MTKSGIRKRQNNNRKYVLLLKKILRYCLEHGHRPPEDSEMSIDLLRLNATMRRRMEHNIEISPELELLYNRVMGYRTQKMALKIKSGLDTEQRQRDQQARENAELQARIANIQPLFPNINILYHVLGADGYKKLIEKGDTGIGLRILNEYLEYLLQRCRFYTKDRNMEILKKACGIGITAEDMYIAKKAFVGRKRIKITRCDPTAGLTSRALGVIYNIGHDRAWQIVYTQISETRKNIMPLFKDYLDGNVAGMMSKLPYGMQKQLSYQIAYKIDGMSTDDLNKAGLWLLKNFKVKQK